MNVAILAAARFTICEPFAGGMEMHSYLLADGLAARGHDVTVHAAGGCGRFTMQRMLPVDFEPTPAARRDISAGPTSALAEHHSYLDAIIRLADSDHDLVHINAVHHLPHACASLLPSIVTATLHTPPTPWLESALALGAGRPAAPMLVSVSRANAAAWTTAEIERVIPNGVNLDAWHEGGGGSGAAWWGRIVPEKAPHLAIDAALLARMPITVMGPIHDERYFAEQIRPRLGPCVRYLGHCSIDVMATVVGNAAVAVVTPLWEEPFGLVVVEALACGTPVAGFARGALPELVDSSSGVLCTPDDVEALADSMIAAAQLDRAACRRRAEERFSASTMVDAYEAWFAELIEGRR